MEKRTEYSNYCKPTGGKLITPARFKFCSWLVVVAIVLYGYFWLFFTGH